MDIALRILHVVIGVFWAGSAFYSGLIMMPKLHALKSDIKRPAMRAVSRLTGPIMMVGSIIVIGSGIWLALRMQGSLDIYFSTGWGLAMLISFIAMIISSVVGFGFIAPAAFGEERLLRSIEGRDPTPDEDQQLERLSARHVALVRVNFVLIFIAVLAMPISRFV